MTSDEIKALLRRLAAGRFATTSGDAVIVPLDRIPEEQQDEVIAWVEANGGRHEHIAPPARPLLRRLTLRRSSLGPLCLVIPRSALF
jgi:hypothetical protein